MYCSIRALSIFIVTLGCPLSLRGCLKSLEMSIFGRFSATSEGAPVVLFPLKSMMPIFPWTPFHAATETFQTGSKASLVYQQRKQKPTPFTAVGGRWLWLSLSTHH